MVGPALLAAVMAFLINVVVTPAIIKLAHKFRWYDDPEDERKIHDEPVPHTGGVGIFAATFIACVAVLWYSEATMAGMVPLVGAFALVACVGIFDDFFDLRARWKFLVQLGAAMLVVGAGPFRFETLSLPGIAYQLELGSFAAPLTILWIVGISNGVNFIDGIDGLAGGIGFIAAAFAGLIGLLAAAFEVTILASSLAGALVAFLVFNRHPARIFMGDSGSLTIGFVLAVLPLAARVFGSSGLGSFGFVAAVTLLFVPILDTGTAIVRRLSRGVAVWHPDREHIHHRLLDVGFRKRTTVLLLYGAALLFGLTATAVVALPTQLGGTVLAAVVLSGAAAFQVRLYRVARRRDAEKYEVREAGVPAPAADAATGERDDGRGVRKHAHNGQAPEFPSRAYQHGVRSSERERRPTGDARG